MSAKSVDEGVRYSCPVELTLDVLGGKWKPLILWELRRRRRGFNALHAAIPTVSHKVLTQQLRALERDGIISRTTHEGRVRTVTYEFSPFGRTLHPVLDGLAHWAKTHYKALGVALDWPARR
jgi:DNA-binding HxlR family transcriptional regulator